MSAHKIPSGWEGQVLAALTTAPLSHIRLIKALLAPDRTVKPCTGSQHRKVALGDALMLLEADGLIVQTPHPIEKFRVYYLTDSGRQLARRATHSNDGKLHTSAKFKIGRLARGRVSKSQDRIEALA